MQLGKAPNAEQVHDLPLLVGLHPRKHNRVAHHGLQQGQVSLLQHVLQGSPRHSTPDLALCQSLQSCSRFQL